MFVRWKKRLSSDKKSYSLAAYLIEAVRINGKPRQKVIAHLCTIKSHKLEKEDAGLWCSVEDRVKKLGLSEETEERIYRSIAEKTPRSTPEKMAESRARSEALDREYGVSAYMKEFSARPVVPDIPNALVDSPTTEIDEKLFLLWKVDNQRPKDASLATYTVSLAKDASKKKPEIVQVLGKIQAQEMKGDTKWKHGWKDFWFSVHFSLCLVAADYNMYRLVMDRIAQWVKLPAKEEYTDIIKNKLRLAEWTVEKELDTAKAKYDKAIQKRIDVYDVRMKSYNYLGME